MDIRDALSGLHRPRRKTNAAHGRIRDTLLPLLDLSRECLWFWFSTFSFSLGKERRQTFEICQYTFFHCWKFNVLVAWLLGGRDITILNPTFRSSPRCFSSAYRVPGLDRAWLARFNIPGVQHRRIIYLCCAQAELGPVPEIPEL